MDPIPALGSSGHTSLDPRVPISSLNNTTLYGNIRPVHTGGISIINQYQEQYQERGYALLYSADLHALQEVFSHLYPTDPYLRSIAPEFSRTQRTDRSPDMIPRRHQPLYGTTLTSKNGLYLKSLRREDSFTTKNTPMRSGSSKMRNSILTWQQYQPLDTSSSP